MAKKSFTDAPRRPTLKRRAAGDLYEGLALIIWLGLSFAMLWFLNEKDQQATIGLDVFGNPLLLSLLIGWLLCSIALLRFDRQAVIRGRKTYESELAHFNKMRSQHVEHLEIVKSLEMELHEAKMRLQKEAMESKFRAPSSDNEAPARTKSESVPAREREEDSEKDAGPE